MEVNQSIFTEINPSITKDKLEILNIIKEIITSSSFLPKQNMFSKSFIKELILNNNEIKKYLFSIKDTLSKGETEKMNMLKTLFSNETSNGRKEKEVRLVFCIYNKKCLLHNEPSFIKTLNEKIYSTMSNSILSLVKQLDFSLIRLRNGRNFKDVLTSDFNQVIEKVVVLNNLNSSLDEITDSGQGNNKNINIAYYSDMSKHILSSKYIINELYSCRSGNISSLTKTSLLLSNMFSFNFKWRVFDLEWYLKMYKSYIDGICDSNNEYINSKKRRETIYQSMSEDNKLMLNEILIKGIPPSMRIEVYKYYLNINMNSDSSSLTGINIKSEKRIVNDDFSFLVDYYLNDELKVLSETENYFLTMDIIVNLSKRILRDSSLLFKLQSTKPILYIKDSSSNMTYPYPPSGIFPYYGISSQIAPFSYFSTSTDTIYSIYYEFYSKYLCKIFSFSSDSNSLISLLYNFDHLFTLLLNELKSHFSTFYFDVNNEVCKWFLNSFTEILSVQDVLLIYDLVLLSNICHIYVLVALGVLNFKKNLLLKMNNSHDVLNCIYYIKFEEIRIIDLIREILN